MKSHAETWRELDAIYSQSCKKCDSESLKLFAMQSLELGITTKYNDVINLVQQGKSDEAFNILFETWSTHYRGAVSGVFKDEGEYKCRLEANVAKMAAYKANKAKEMLIDCFKEKPEKYIANARAVLRKLNRWQMTEYNTIISRSRTAKQWEKFETTKNIYPNLTWLPTRSAYPRDEHQKLVGLTLPKNHPFWKENQPGNLWGCKCDWIETDKPMNTKGLDVNNVKIQAKGLEGNPGETKEIFSDEASYIRLASKEVINKIVKCYISDTKSILQISVLSQGSELMSNIYTGRILANNSYVKTIEIRPHFKDQTENSIPNPEYKINGIIADAKRVRGYKGVKYGFISAIGQECKIVIIDFNKYFYNKTLKISEIAKYIDWRWRDFENGTIEKCFVIHKDKSIIIDRTMKGRDAIKNELKRLKPRE